MKEEEMKKNNKEEIMKEDKEKKVEKKTEKRYSPEYIFFKLGDTLDSIAKKHKTTVEKIKELNGITEDSVFAGNQLRVK